MGNIKFKTFSFQFFILLVFLIPCSKESSAQSYPVKHFTEQNGLPGMTVYRLLQDHVGYLWLATDHGLCRYDGQNFQRIDSPELEGYEILTLSIDAKNRIWFSSFLGQICFYENGRIVRFNPPGLPDNISILFLYIDSNNTVWVCTQKVIYKYRESEDPGNFNLLSKIELKPGSSLFNISEDINNRIWSTRYSNTSKIIELYSPEHPDSTGITIGPGGPSLVYNTPSGRTFVFMAFQNTRIFEIKDQIPVKLFPELYSQMTGGTFSMIEDHSGHLWITSKRGVFHFDENLNVQNLQSPVLDGIQVNHMIQDQEGNYWFATNGEGLFFMPSKQVINYSRANSSLAKDQIYSITNDDKGTICLGLGEGYISCLNDKEFRNFSVGSKVRVTALHFDSNTKTLFAGTDHKLFQLKNRSLKTLDFNGSIKAISPGVNDIFWVATGSHVYQVNPAPLNKITRYEGRSYDVFTDISGDTWLSTKSGIWVFNGDTIAKFEFPKIKASKIRVSEIKQSSDSTIWLATYGQGVFSYKNDVIGRYTIENGLTSNICKSMIASPNGLLWIGTDKGLNRLDLSNNSFIPVTKLDGLQSNMINTLFAYDGKIWVGTPKGMSVFSQETDFLDTLPPVICISRIAIAGRDTTILPEFTIPASQKDILIEFNGISYKSGDQMIYQYRMLGLDSAWTETKNRSLSFGRLSPGDYRFEVISINADGFPSSETAAVNIKILPPFSGTLWFKIGFIAAIAGLIGFAVYLAVFFTRKYQKREQAIKEKIDQLRMQALQAQMNPHFIFNALNAILHLLSVNDRKSAIKYLAMFARLIRLIFEHSKKNRIPLDSEIEFLKLYLELEKLRFEEKIMIDFNIDEKISPQNIRIPPLLIQPIIENAFKHGLLHKESGGLLHISFDLEGKYLKCTIEDNGVGREKAKELGSWRPKDYLSSGLKTTEERLSLLNKSEEPGQQQVHMKVHDLVDSFGESAGTKVVLSIEVV